MQTFSWERKCFASFSRKRNSFGRECIIVAPLVVPNRITKVPISKQIFTTHSTLPPCYWSVKQIAPPPKSHDWLSQKLTCQVTPTNQYSDSATVSKDQIILILNIKLMHQILSFEFVNVQTSLLKNAFYFSRSSCNANGIFYIYVGCGFKLIWPIRQTDEEKPDKSSKTEKSFQSCDWFIGVLNCCVIMSVTVTLHMCRTLYVWSELLWTDE